MGLRSAPERDALRSVQSESDGQERVSGYALHVEFAVVVSEGEARLPKDIEVKSPMSLSWSCVDSKGKLKQLTTTKDRKNDKRIKERIMKLYNSTVALQTQVSEQ